MRFEETIQHILRGKLIGRCTIINYENSVKAVLLVNFFSLTRLLSSSGG